MPKALTDALDRLRRSEADASGHELRTAWRDTGQLVAAALELGYGARAVAHTLGTTPSSVRSRARGGEWLSLDEAARLLDLPADTLSRYASDGMLAAGRVDENGVPSYHRRDILMLLISGLPDLPRS